MFFIMSQGWRHRRWRDSRVIRGGGHSPLRSRLARRLSVRQRATLPSAERIDRALIQGRSLFLTLSSVWPKVDLLTLLPTEERQRCA